MPRTLLLPLVLFLAGGLEAQEPAAQERPGPNLLLFLVDDMGWRDAGYQGSRYYLTPHLDALAAEGRIFPQAYSDGPNCAPTRASIMTGRATPQHGVITVASSARGKAKDRRLVPIANRKELRDEERTLAEVLSERGYATWHLGKWHLGADPRSQGFEVNVGGNRAGSPPGGHRNGPEHRRRMVAVLRRPKSFLTRGR